MKLEARQRDWAEILLNRWEGIRRIWDCFKAGDYVMIRPGHVTRRSAQPKSYESDKSPHCLGPRRARSPTSLTAMVFLRISQDVFRSFGRLFLNCGLQRICG